MAKKKEEEYSEEVLNSYWKCRCDCGYEVSVLGDDLVNGKVISCGCHKLDNLLPKVPRIVYKKDGSAKCHFSTVEDQKETFLVDAEDTDIVKAADWYLTCDGHVRGRDKKTGEFYLLEEQVVYKHHEHFFGF